MKRRLAAATAVFMLLLAGCSSEPARDQADRGVAPEKESSGKNEKGKKKGASAARNGNVKGSGAGKGESAARGDDRGGDRSAGGSGDGGEGAPEEGMASAPYPTSGTYVFGQSGFEEFCQTASCDRKDLPPEQSVEVSYKKRSESKATVVSEARSSKGRVSRTTFKFTPEGAYVVEVYTKSNFNNVQFEDTYRPDPPIEALRFPIRTGESWSGEWKDRTSGSYRISIGPREAVDVGGRTVHAFRVETDVEFRGQFEGRSNGITWVDPDTKSIVKSEGEIDVKSAFGRYHSVFETILKSGPGY